MKKLALCITAAMAVLISSINTAAQTAATSDGWVWHNPMDEPQPALQNQAWQAETGKGYMRLPQRAFDVVRGPVWYLAGHSAGLALHFYSNAPEIKLRYTVTGPLHMHHMPPTGVSGTDLYAVDQYGRELRLFGFFNSSSDTIHTRFVNDRMKEFHSCGYEFRLYLPLYNGVKELEIGVPQGCSFEFLPASKERPVVVYGTSIEQGAVASRPGMAWTTLVQRSLDMPLVNLGFSGNGRLEQPILDLMTEIPARAFVLATAANLCQETDEQLDSLYSNAVYTLRRNNPAPIVFTEHAGFGDAGTNASQQEILTRQSRGLRKCYDRLVAEGVKDLYYVSARDLAVPAEGWVDDVHPSDLGMVAMAGAVEPVLRKALNIPQGTASTTRAVTQRREANGYEWRRRHEQIVERNAANPPRRVIIGNSITHFWGGEPADYHVNGAKSWKRAMAKRGFGNLGCGWDMIENALWRVYHGELDGYEAEQVVLMIGTNNTWSNTPQEIAQGIGFLADAVRVRQPGALIKVVGLLPKRGAEDYMAEINRLIEAMAAEKGLKYVNPGVKMLLPNGKINEALFSDGLHPNEKGYALIEREIAE